MYNSFLLFAVFFLLEARGHPTYLNIELVFSSFDY